LDEIVAKCTLMEVDASNIDSARRSYSAIMYESATLKLLKNNDYMAKIKEEIIEVNLNKEIITRYCSI
jgi:hypothetical protein